MRTFLKRAKTAIGAHAKSSVTLLLFKQIKFSLIINVEYKLTLNKSVNFGVKISAVSEKSA